MPQLSPGIAFPTRTAGLTKLGALGDIVGKYAIARNYADGRTTSQLSPYIRRRLVLEEEVLNFAREISSFERVEKFMQEVVWRTYWKGWLEARPVVWDAYLARLRSLKETLDPTSRDRLICATSGATDMPYFNAWCDELKSTGYLHNHVRMWFASVWVFTLKLPWELGARFFLDHLLDGDAAVNTLSWRWVAGLQTRGKHYLARADNIAKYTNGRYVVANRPHHSLSELVTTWVSGACADADSRVGTVKHTLIVEEVAEWCQANGAVELWAYRPLVGFVASALAELAAALAPLGVTLRYADRRHDLAFFPLVTKGFFSFWEAASVPLRTQ